MPDTMLLTPACGADYTSRIQLLAAWFANHNFILADIFGHWGWDDKPINRTQIEAMNDPPKVIEFRFNRLTNVYLYTNKPTRTLKETPCSKPPPPPKSPSNPTPPSDYPPNCPALD